MESKSFPVLSSGRIRLAGEATDSFDLECSDADVTDYRQLMGFFNQMHGRFGQFHFEYANVVNPKCRIDHDSAEFISQVPDRYSVTLPIRVLR